MSVERRKYIQKIAGTAFPSQELWYREGDNSFWAFENKEYEHVISFTSGFFENNTLKFRTVTQIVDDDENSTNILQTETEKKRTEGFECFAISL
jgi:hypothetical protein